MFSEGYLLQQLLNGLTLGSMYALVAIGFSLIFGILSLINFAHGDVLMLGAFAAYFVVHWFGVSFWALIILILFFGAVLGLLIERVAFRPIRKAPPITGFITSLAVATFIENAGILIVTAQPRNFPVPDFLNRLFTMGTVSCRGIDMVIIFLSLLLMGILTLFVKKTKIGMAMRATSENLDAARLMGIKVNRVIALAFAIGSALAAIAGMMWGSKYGQIDPLMGFVPGLKAFVAAVIGGIESMPGAMLGGYFLGFSEVLFVGLLPPQMGSYRDAFVFSLLILILLLKPSGILGRREEAIK
ncbi:MAG: branched-chain amino acid ABC transporter permease [Synergistetes bacterium]|nr:branched-chain amino acid ABC transporter permease [Synergistota bacterium]